MSSTDTDMQRLEARIPTHTKDLLLQAARLEGRSLTDFIIEPALARAHEVINSHEAIRLNRADQIQLAQALLNPPAPSEKLRNAMKAYLVESVK